MPVATTRLIRAATCLALLLVVPAAGAGGPLQVRDNGVSYVWSTAAPIPYRTDNGPISATVDEATARARVTSMFAVWEGVPTSNIAFTRAGFISATGAFSDGDVSTAAEYAAVNAACDAGNQSPVVYDTDATILVDLGFDEESVIGFAGPCVANATQYLAGLVVMNGLFQDGAATPVQDLSVASFDAALIHEIGHFAGLGHSQVNVNCLTPCGADDLAGLPTMFPFLVHSSQGQLSPDDIAWISRLYPQTSGGTTFANTHGTITGIVFFADGESHAQLVNVIARQVNTGGGQDRRIAVSSVSGYKFRVFHGNPINDPGGDSAGSEAPGDIGLFEIPVPAGNYTLTVETINEEFTDGSSVGAIILIPMPGTAPAPVGPVAVVPGAIVPGNNITLIGTPPRFDQFEGP